MAKQAARLAAETAKYLSADTRRDDMRAGKEQHRAAEAARLEEAEDPSLAQCTTRDLRVELAQCFNAQGVLRPREQHPLQLRYERTAFMALGVFTGSAAAQNAKLDALLCDVWRLQTWVEDNSVELEGGLGCRALKPVGEWEALPEGWSRGCQCAGQRGEFQLNRGKTTHLFSSVPLLINALKHVSTSRSSSGSKSMYCGAHRCRVAICVAGHTVLRDISGQVKADAGCAGAASEADDNCMHSAMLDAAGERTIDDSLRCLVPGNSIHFDGEGRAALGSEWMAKGSKAQLEIKAELAALIEEHAVLVTRAIPDAFCGEGFPFREGDECGDCLEFGDSEPKLRSGNAVFNMDGYPAISSPLRISGCARIVNLMFLGHPMHSTGTAGYHAVHRCHNPAVRTPTPPQFCAPCAPRLQPTYN